MFVTSSILTKVGSVLHGFGTLGEPIPKQFQRDWDISRPQWQQVHGAGVGEVMQPLQRMGDVDALFTGLVRVPVAVVTADCVPILMAHQSGKRVAAIHAGWRGTKARIIEKVWQELKRKGENPDEWVAALGPSIGPCCYQVSDELAFDFVRQFSKIPARMVMPSPRMLDLPSINAAELQRLGVSKVEKLDMCTRCSEGAIGPLFHSYRREGGGTRQWSVIMRARG